MSIKEKSCGEKCKFVYNLGFKDALEKIYEDIGRFETTLRYSHGASAVLDQIKREILRGLSEIQNENV